MSFSIKKNYYKGSVYVSSSVDTFIDASGNVIGYSINQLREIVNPSTIEAYYCIESGKEGFWKYDQTDISSSDNLGTVLVTTSGKRLKRVVNDVVYPEWFGAVYNDPLVNNASYIQATLDSGIKNIQFKESVTYYVNNSVNIPSDTNIVGNNTIIKSRFDISSVGLFQTQEVVTFDSSASIAVTKGINTFTFSGASNLTVGNIVFLKGQVYITSGVNTYENGWYSVIQSINGNIVTLSTPAVQSMTSSRIIEYKSYDNILIKGLTFDMTGSTNGFGIFLNNCVDSMVSNCTLQADNTSTTAVVGIMALGENIKINQNNVYGFRYVTENAGYGINVGGNGIIVEQNKTSGSKHGIAAAGRTWFSNNIQYNNNNVIGGAAAGIDIHANVNNSSMTNNSVYVSQGNSGFELRSSNVVFIGNNVYINNTSGTDAKGVYVYEAGGSNTIIENTNVYISGYVSGGSNKCIIFDQVQQVIDNCEIKNCYLEGQLEIDSFTASVNTIKINGNIFNGKSLINSYINLGSNCKYYWIQKNKFINNGPISFNFSIKAPENFSIGYIEENDFIINDISNNQPQIRINNNSNINLMFNTFRTNSTSSLIFNTVSSGNLDSIYLYNNKRLDTSNNYYPVTYTSIPTPSNFFVDKLISVLSSNATKYYIGTQLTSNSYSFLEIPDLTGNVILSGTLKAKQLYAQTGISNTPTIVLGATQGSIDISTNTTKVGNITYPNYTASSSTDRLVTAFSFNSDSTNNYLRYGGGTTVGGNSYPITDHEWYTDSYNINGNGTRKMKLFSSGNLSLHQTGTNPPDNNAKLQVFGLTDLSGALRVQDVSGIVSTTNDISNNFSYILWNNSTNRLQRTNIQTTKTFVIDHPLYNDKYLVHSCLEGPEAGVYYRGFAQFKKNEREIIIKLPDYVSSLAKDFTINITQTYNNIEDDDFYLFKTTNVINNNFKIYRSSINNIYKFIDINWTVFGKRFDIITEPNKNSVIIKGDGPYTYI